MSEDKLDKIRDDITDIKLTLGRIDSTFSQYTITIPSFIVGFDGTTITK